MKTTFDNPNDIAMVVVTKESISAQDFINLAKTKPEDIKRASFVAPRIGDSSFGHFEVEYRNAKLVPA